MPTTTGSIKIASTSDSMLFRNGATVSFSLSRTIPAGSTINYINIKIPIYVKGNTSPSSSGTFAYYGTGSYLTLGNLTFNQEDLIPSGTFPAGAFGTDACLSGSFSETISIYSSTATLKIAGQFIGFNTATVFSHNSNAEISITYTEPSSGGSGGDGDSGGSGDENGGSGSNSSQDYSSPTITISREPDYGRYALSSGTYAEIQFSVNANSGSNKNFTCSDSGITILYASSSTPKATGNFIGGKTYTFTATNSFSKTSSLSIKFEAIPTLTVSVSYGNETLIDDSPSDGYKLCNLIQKLKGVAMLNGLVTTIGISNSWSYSYGTSSTNMTEDYKKIAGITGSSITSLDIVSKTSGTTNAVKEGDYYEIQYEATYIHESGITQTAYAILDTFRYPKKLQEITGLSISEVFNGGSFYNIGDKGYFNNECYFTINYPSIKNGFSKISQVNILLAYSERNSFSLYSTNQTYSYNNESSKEIIIDLEASAVSRGNYFSIGVRLVDKLGQTVEIYKNKNEDSNISFNRIQLPYFGTNKIDSSSNSIITLNYNPVLSAGNANLLSLAIPTPYTYNTSISNLTGDIIADLLGTLYLRRYNTNDEYNFILADLSTDLAYNITTSTGYIYITLDELKNNFSEFLSQNITVELKVSLSFKDDFGNICNQTFTINHNNEITNDILSINFGSPPIMPDYNSSQYYMTIQYNGDTISNPVENGTMINSGDILSITFPKASDANGENDIQEYKIKIYRSDSNLSTYLEGDNSYQLLATIPKTSFSSLLNGNLYTYKHTVNNYVVSKFIKLAVSAYDSSGLESNLVEFSPMLIAGRVTSSSSNIKNFQYDSGTNNVNFTLSVTDIGGNKFNNQNITYLDYPNLERNYVGGTSGKIIIDLQHREAESEYITIAENISFKIGSLSNTDSYTYTTILTNYITITDLKITEVEINPSVKNYYRFIVHVQTGFSGTTPVYQTGYSSEYISYPSTPTVAYRKNHIGLNTESFNSYENAILVAAAGVDSRDILYFVYEDKYSSVNIKTGEIDGFIVDGGEW